MLPAYAGMIHPANRAQSRQRAVLPAYAGMIPPTLTLWSLQSSAPRIRGDDPDGKNNYDGK